MKKRSIIRKIECMVLVLLIFCISHLIAEPCGDVNSKDGINIVDALLIAQFYVGLDPADFDEAAADVNADGKINIVDALLVAQYYVGLITELPGCNQTPTPTPGELQTYELQAETEATWSSGGTESINSGFTGSGYVNTDNFAGEWVQWSFDVVSETNAHCVFRYASASGTRSMDLIVNGNNITSLTFPSTGSWTTWLTEEAIFGLIAGENTIRLAAITDDGAPNMDKLDITIGSSIVTPEPTLTPGPTATPGPTLEPSEINDNPHGYARDATGGGNASPQTISSASAFKSAVSGSGSAVIIVNGKLNVGTVSIGSNKTIIGANSSSGLYGGVIKVGGSNYIFKNLIIGPNSGDDAMEISGGSKIFIHKVTFVDGADGSCDIVRGSDYVTLSYCKFYYTTSSDHRYPVLIGNSDGATGDRGKLHVTIHHTWFDNGCMERLPRVRFGTVHLYNNLYASNTNNYCIGLGKECRVRVENSVFVNQKELWRDWGGSSTGEFGWSNLKLEGSSSLPNWMPNSFPVFNPGYSFSVDSVDTVKNRVMANAGNIFN